MDTLAKFVMGCCMVGLGLLAVGLIVRFLYESGMLAALMVIAVAIGCMAIVANKSRLG